VILRVAGEQTITMTNTESNRPKGEALLSALEIGEVRVAERLADGSYRIHAWVKEGILEIFRTSAVVPQRNEVRAEELAIDPRYGAPFRDKAPLSVRRFGDKDNVRVVPGGSSVRRGTYLAPGVVCMPPMFVNVGAFVGAGTMIDSHALVGSCAQIGERVHLSAAAQIGGVLEPANARPVIIEDDAFIGGNCGIYEGVLVRKGAVIAAGVVLTAGTPLFDLARNVEIIGTREKPLEIPERAVVVPGTRPVKSAWGRERGLQAACALIVKYRDEKTDRATALEDALR
jgi:2,3,4,5-tetrahydropyridine-2-carboxylate N-succinyltransferase